MRYGHPTAMTDGFPHRDTADDRNGHSHHTGKPCIEKGCNEPAGTAWSHLWCQKHNAERMDRISESLVRILEGMKHGR